jgi:hypothetical protein
MCSTRTDRCIHGEGFSSKFSTWELQNRKTIETKDDAEDGSILSTSYCTKEEHPPTNSVGVHLHRTPPMGVNDQASHIRKGISPQITSLADLSFLQQELFSAVIKAERGCDSSY